MAMPSDLTGDEVGAPPLCPFCVARLARADEHLGHIDPDWTARAVHDFWVQCCTPRDRSLR